MGSHQSELISGCHDTPRSSRWTRLYRSGSQYARTDGFPYRGAARIAKNLSPAKSMIHDVSMPFG